MPLASAPLPALAPAPDRPPPLRLGALEVSPPVVLAPMSALTNMPMRRLCEEAGCGLTITEFIAAPALARGVPKEVAKLQPSSEGRAFGVQIFGRDPRQMCQAARLALRYGAALVDINMGCPVKKVTKGMAGAALMREPQLAAELVAAVREGTAGQALVTVKMRAGWDQQSRNAPEFAGRMVAAGAQAVTVHGRTRQQAFSGQVDLEIIRQVKQAVTVPVIGNGDVVDRVSLARMFAETGCDGVMIGRAALGNPWIFTVARAWWSDRPDPLPPTVAERVAMYLRHLDYYLRIADEARALVEMRKFAVWYLKGFPDAAQLRRRIFRLGSVAEVRQLVQMVALASLPAS